MLRKIKDFNASLMREPLEMRIAGILLGYISLPLSLVILAMLAVETVSLL